MILCSDFLMPPEALQKVMQGYAALNLRGAFVHILDPIEADFTLDGRVELLGCEGEIPMLLPNARATETAYKQRLEEHKVRLQRMAESAGWHYVRHVTGEQPYLPLLRIYQALTAGNK
jgi:uncharacterized protein (DUF58 family)